MKHSEAAELVLMMLAAFPSAKVTDSTSQVYEGMLADIDVAVARRAVHKLIATSKWFPTVAEIREACGVVPLSAPYHREWKPDPVKRPELPAARPVLKVVK